MMIIKAVSKNNVIDISGFCLQQRNFYENERLHMYLDAFGFEDGKVCKIPQKDWDPRNPCEVIDLEEYRLSRVIERALKKHLSGE